MDTNGKKWMKGLVTIQVAVLEFTDGGKENIAEAIGLLEYIKQTLLYEHFRDTEIQNAVIKNILEKKVKPILDGNDKK